MPIESVQCPNCGSGDVRQLAADSYSCEHCHTKFHWVNPTKKTVVHRSSACECGAIPKAFCVRCHKPLCKRHSELWLASVDIDLEFHPARPSEEARRRMNEHRIPLQEDVVTVCARCQAECKAAIETIAKPFTAAARQGRACWLCNSDQIVGRCAICEAQNQATGTWAICSTHATRCKRCHQLVCTFHMNRESSGGGDYGGVCPACYAKNLQKGQGCAGAILWLVFTSAAAGLGQWATLS